MAQKCNYQYFFSKCSIFNVVNYLNKINMKKTIISFVFALFLGLVFTSCSKDDSPSSASASVVGKWNYSKISFTINGVTSPEIDYDDDEPGCSKDYIEFKTAGVYNEGDYSGTTCVLDLTVGTWSETGSQLTITADGTPASLEILSVTSSTLKVKVKEGADSGTVTFVKM
jgi:hypothetical protein